MIDLKLLIKNGVQFGHQTWRWCPKMSPYIWGKKNGVHLIDVSKTALQLQKACKFLEEVAASGKPILWVGTKKAAQGTIERVARETGCPFVNHRWIGGTLSNFPQVKKSVTKMLHYKDVIAKADQHTYTKKEYGVFTKIADRLEANVGGIQKLTWPIAALVVVDVRKEHVAVKEALTMGVPIVALVDTNCDPSGIAYVIPGNDDVPRSVSVLMNELGEAVKRGRTNVKAIEVEADGEKVVDILIQKLQAEEASDEEEGKKAPKKAMPTRRPAAPATAGRDAKPRASSAPRKPAPAAARRKPAAPKAADSK